MYDTIIVGAGFSGAICAYKFAHSGRKVLLLEKRNHVAGNMYDYYDEEGALIHKYGPHVIMTDKVWIKEFINDLDDIIDIEVKMEVCVKKDLIVPLPINLNAIDLLYSYDKAELIKRVIALHIENTTDKNIQLLAENYVPAAKRYEKAVPEIEAMQADIEIMKKVITEHSEKLQKLA